ncbi:IQ-DOMAIN 14-like protein [Tanacetum coccineum]
MGKTIKWFKSLFGLKKERKQSNSGDPKNKLSSCMGRSPRGYPASSPDASSSDVTPLIKPVGVGRELNRRAIAVAVATTRAADVSFVAAQAAVNYVAFTSENLNNSAAITIQSMFRGYLARKALKALKSVVKLQAIVRGFLVRKGAAETLQGMEAMFKVRSRACSQRSRLQDDKYHSKRSIRRGSESRSRRMSSSFQIPNDASLNFVEESPQMPKSKLTRNNTWAWPADSNSRTPSPFRRRFESQQQRRTRCVVARRSAGHGMPAGNLESDSAISQGWASDKGVEETGYAGLPERVKDSGGGRVEHGRCESEGETHDEGCEYTRTRVAQRQRVVPAASQRSSATERASSGVGEYVVCVLEYADYTEAEDARCDPQRDRVLASARIRWIQSESIVRRGWLALLSDMYSCGTMRIQALYVSCLELLVAYGTRGMVESVARCYMIVGSAV